MEGWVLGWIDFGIAQMEKATEAVKYGVKCLREIESATDSD